MKKMKEVVNFMYTKSHILSLDSIVHIFMLSLNQVILILNLYLNFILNYLHLYKE